MFEQKKNQVIDLFDYYSLIYEEACSVQLLYVTDILVPYFLIHSHDDILELVKKS